MNVNYKHITQQLALSSYFLTAAITAEAIELQSQVEIAMYTPVNGITKQPIQTRLSAEKMLLMADSLNTKRMSRSQKNLAFALTFSAAKKGSAEAQFRLANYYLESDLVTADDNEAAFWLEEASAQGHYEAKFIYEHLGVADFDVGC